MATILITGGAGFIGSNLVVRLADRGDRVSISDRLGSGDKWRNIARADIDELVPPTALDDFLERRGSEVDFVYHLAAATPTEGTDVDLIVETNYALSQHIWRWCTRREIPLVYASSAATYGDGSRGFRDDGTSGALARLRPMNALGWSRHAFDRWVAREVEGGKGHPPTWYGLKFFSVYGPNEAHRGATQSLVNKAYPLAVAGKPVTLFRSHHPDYEDGGQMRDFIYVGDCVDVMEWLRDEQPTSGLYNLGTGQAESRLGLMNALYAAVGQELKVDWVDTPEEVRDRYQYFTRADISKLRNAGYSAPFLSVENGVRAYVEDHLTPGKR